jgi:hypothetical protein
MNYLWSISIIFQVYFAVHAYRNGRTSWIFIILFFPMVGVLIYFFAEYLPDLRHGTSMEQVSVKLVKKFAPERELQRLKDHAAFNNSVNNRVALARGHIEVGHFDEAIQILIGCLDGIYKNDPQVLSALASAYFHAGKSKEALDTLMLLRKQDCRSNKETDLLIAKALEQMDDLDGALREYEAILQKSVGEEVRCRYGLLLKKLGREDDARARFEEILRNVKVSPRYYRRTQRPWIQIAKRELQLKAEAAKQSK